MRHSAMHDCAWHWFRLAAPVAFYGAIVAAMTVASARVGAGRLPVVAVVLLFGILARSFTGSWQELMPEPFLRWYRDQSAVAELFGVLLWWPCNTIGTVHYWLGNTFGWRGDGGADLDSTNRRRSFDFRRGWVPLPGFWRWPWQKPVLETPSVPGSYPWWQNSATTTCHGGCCDQALSFGAAVHEVWQREYMFRDYGEGIGPANHGRAMQLAEAEVRRRWLPELFGPIPAEDVHG